MTRSRTSDALLPDHRAPQHERAPRPLPLFLELVRLVSEREPAMAQAALEGLAAYEAAERPTPRNPAPAVAAVGPAKLRDLGGKGAPVVLVPSLINPPNILDLDDEVSLAGAIRSMGRHVLLVDWGVARDRQMLDVGGHVSRLLIPLLRELPQPPALIGYCLGGTMAIAAAQCTPVERLVTLAAPWHFNRYPDEARYSLQALWRSSSAAAERMGALPMEVLQGAFWSLDPHRTVAKFAKFGMLPSRSSQVKRFVALEDWANDGEPLPWPTARQLIEDFFVTDMPGSGRWTVDGRVVSDCVTVPLLNFTAAADRIAPAATAPAGETVNIPAGHVGMVVGRARAELHQRLASYLDS